MPIDQLLDALDREAQAQATQFVADARVEAERITALGRQELASRRENSVGPERRRLQAEQQAALGMVRRDAAHDMLRARERLKDRVMTAVCAALPACATRADVRESMRRSLEQALGYVTADVAVEVRCPTQLLDSLSATAAGRSRVQMVADPEAGVGFVLRTVDDRLEIKDGLDTRLERRANAVMRQALSRLSVA